MSDASNITQQLVNSWLKAADYSRSLYNQYHAANIVKEEAEKRLAIHLAPKDVKPGESFCMWVRNLSDIERLVHITWSGTVWNIKWRK